jgi:c-di-AMP phosphodiesterase-like protein
MQSNIETATSRYDIMRNAEIYRDNIALASAIGIHSRISVAQAADELLNIKGVLASFVAAQDGSDVFVSGRSIGELNVQVVLEKLGGGGSQATAGLQVQDTTASDIIEKIKTAIDECFK